MKNKVLKTAISVLLSLLIATSCCVVMAQESELDLTLPEDCTGEENAAFWQSVSAMSEEEISALYEEMAADFNETSSFNMEDELGTAEAVDGGTNDISSALTIINGFLAMREGINAFDITKPLEWAGQTATQMLFQEKADKILDGVNELNRKADAINNKLLQIEEQLKKLGKQAEVNAVENDLQSARAANKELKTFVDEFRNSALSKKGATDQERTNAFVALMNTYYPKVFVDLNNLAHYLYEQDNIHTHKSLYYNLQWLTKSNYFVWDSWEIAFQNLSMINFTATYLETLSYVLVLLTYSRDNSAPGSMQRQDYDNKLQVAKNNFDLVMKEADANQIKPVGGSDDTVSFRFGDGKYLTFSKHLRGLGTPSGVNLWKYPEGVTMYNFERNTFYDMAYAKEKIADKNGKSKTYYAVNYDTYKLWFRFIKFQGANIGINPLMRPYEFAKQAGFYLGNSREIGKGYNAGVLSNMRSFTGFEYEYFTYPNVSDTFVKEIIGYLYYIEDMLPDIDGLRFLSGFQSNALLMFLTPDVSIGNTVSPYTLQNTTLDKTIEGEETVLSLITDELTWSHGTADGVEYTVSDGSEEEIEIVNNGQVYLNDQLLDPSCYEIDGESITLKPTYLETLNSDIYRLMIVQPDYKAMGGLYVVDDPQPVSPTPSKPEEPKPANNDVPKTGDGSNVPYIALTAMLCAVAFVFIKRKKINK